MQARAKVRKRSVLEDGGEHGVAVHHLPCGLFHGDDVTGLDGFLARGPVGGADLVAVLVDELVTAYISLAVASTVP